MGKEDAIVKDKLIGVIIPPPEIKKVIDKAANLTAQFGSKIEEKFQSEERNLPKFSFLNSLFGGFVF